MPRSKAQQSSSRRGFLRVTLELGYLAAAVSLLEACGTGGEVTPREGSPVSEVPSPEATMVPSRTARPSATAMPSATVAPSATTAPSATAEPSATTAPSATATANPTATATTVTAGEGEMAQLAFVKTRDRAEGVRRALELLNLNPVKGKQVMLKPNFNSADPAPGSTHPDTLRSLVEALWGMEARSITVGDRSGMDATRTVMEKLGVFEMAEALGFDTLVFDEMNEEQDWVRLQPRDSHWKRGFLFARACYEAEALVQTCCLKTHRFGGHFTMSLKNAVGMVAYSDPWDDYGLMNELHSSSQEQRKMIAEINIAYSPALIVMDGVEAFVSQGPERGQREWGEVVVAGTDRVAMDALGVALLRHLGCQGPTSEGLIFEQEQIARAVELGLGVDGPEKIQLLVGDPDSESYAAQIQEILLQG